MIQYGYLGLFCSMALGIVGLPIPDETILTFAGYLVSQKYLHLIPVILFSFLGSISGVSTSFILGRTLGIRVLNKLQRSYHGTDKKLEKIKKWLDSYGNWVFLFGYFIPGIRHLTAITAGTVKIKYIKFAAFAYIGALLWSSAFILIGYFAGQEWIHIMGKIHDHLILFIIAALILVFIYILIKNKFEKSKNS